MSDLSELSHTFVSFGSGAEVILMDPGAAIGPEMAATIAAIYSRSDKGFREHIGIAEKRGAEQFMADTFVGFGHQSVGDNGSLHLFVEGISMLAAKELQDDPKYNGQETSTRYVDFAKRRFIDPVGTPASQAALERLRSFYLKALAGMIPELKTRFPIQEGEKPAVYEKAIKARAFDIVRSFLPAGASTNAVWHGNIRTLSDRIPIWRHHPLKEVRLMGTAIEQAVLSRYPSSFASKEDPKVGKRYPANEEYLSRMGALYEYYEDEEAPEDFKVWSTAGITRKRFDQYRDAFALRPPKSELPYVVRDVGTMEVLFPLDFGSYRDLQRHRALSIPMPLLTAEHGFEPWYLEQLTPALREEAEAMLAANRADIKHLELSKAEAQYYLPMGYRVPIRLTGDLRAVVYMVELRATRFVHPTLRVRAKQIAQTLTDRFGDWGLVLHLDQDPDRFDVRRGEQDIVVKT